MSAPDSRLLTVLGRYRLEARFAIAHGPDGTATGRADAWFELARRLLHDYAPEFGGSGAVKSGGRRTEPWLTDSERRELFQAGWKANRFDLISPLFDAETAQAWFLRAKAKLGAKALAQLAANEGLRSEMLPERYRSFRTIKSLEKMHARAKKAVGDKIDTYLPESTYRMLFVGRSRGA